MNNSEPTSPTMPSYIFELEQGLLFLMLIQRSALNEIATHLNPQSFTHPHHRIIAECIFQLYNQGKSVDAMLVASHITSLGLGGGFDYDAYLSELSRLRYAPLYYHRDIYVLLEYVIRRDTHELAMQTLSAAHDDTADAESLFDNFQAGLYDVAAQNIKQPAGTIKPLIGQSIERIKCGLSPDIIPCGFQAIDEICGGGFALTDLIVLAARPATGKSAFALALARNIAYAGTPVALFSLEMSQSQMVNRLISAETGIPLQNIMHGNLTASRHKSIANNLNNLYKCPIIIDDTPALTLFALRAKARRLVAEFGVRVILVDYLQLMNAAAKGRPREQEISAISRGLKMIAKDMNVLVIALSQLSRSVETRGGDGKPRLSDLRESGAIEQDADGVLFLYRPELYGITQDEDGLPTQKMIEVIIAKYRHAGTGTAKLRFDAPYMRFRELAESVY